MGKLHCRRHKWEFGGNGRREGRRRSREQEALSVQRGAHGMKSGPMVMATIPKSWPLSPSHGHFPQVMATFPKIMATIPAGRSAQGNFNNTNGPNNSSNNNVDGNDSSCLQSTSCRYPSQHALPSRPSTTPTGRYYSYLHLAGEEMEVPKGK